MSFRKTLLAATMLMAAPALAQAQPVTGFYVAGAAGANWQSNVTADADLFATLTQRTTYSVGWALLGSGGWGFGNGLRLEGEVNYRTNDTDGVTVGNAQGPFANVNPTGSASTLGLMVNALYDIGATQGWPVHITLGAGIGYAWTRYGNVGSQMYMTGGNGPTMNLDGTSGGFAWQLIGGIGVPVRAVPGLAVTLEYRYLQTADASVTATWSEPSQRYTANTNVSNQNQSVLLGVRYNFGRAPAPAPVAVVPAPARSFIVFFDFNRHDLTARAREIIAQAAAAARSQQVTRIEVAGHTDTVGSAQYNLGLSQRRANTVAAELVRLGVPREAISTAGYGFSRPLVPTGPNVREPQNRRVEIVFR